MIRDIKSCEDKQSLFGGHISSPRAKNMHEHCKLAYISASIFVAVLGFLSAHLPDSKELA